MDKRRFWFLNLSSRGNNLTEGGDVAEETKLIQSSQNEDCFIISVSDCEVVEASEAFQIETITQMIQRSDLV